MYCTQSAVMPTVRGGIARSKRDGTRAETRFGLSAKQTSPFKSAGVSVQSTAVSLGVQISGQQLYRPCSDTQWKTAGYPLYSHLSPSLSLPCVTVCHQIPNALYMGICLLNVFVSNCLYLQLTPVLTLYRNCLFNHIQERG